MGGKVMKDFIVRLLKSKKFITAVLTALGASGVVSAVYIEKIKEILSVLGG
jgi:uncharacterized membrane protein (UPF0136 family)